MSDLQKLFRAPHIIPSSEAVNPFPHLSPRTASAVDLYVEEILAQAHKETKFSK